MCYFNVHKVYIQQNNLIVTVQTHIQIGQWRVAALSPRANQLLPGQTCFLAVRRTNGTGMWRDRVQHGCLLASLAQEILLFPADMPSLRSSLPESRGAQRNEVRDWDPLRPRHAGTGALACCWPMLASCSLAFMLEEDLQAAPVRLANLHKE